MQGCGEVLPAAVGDSGVLKAQDTRVLRLSSFLHQSLATTCLNYLKPTVNSAKNLSEAGGSVTSRPV